MITQAETPDQFDLYLRLSDARQEEALDGRERKLRTKAAQLGVTVRRVVVENDVEPDGTIRPASAFKRTKIVTPSGRVELRVIRPGFRAILDALTAGHSQGVLAEDLDRTARDPRDLEDLIDAVAVHGASALSLSGSLTLTRGGTDSEITMARVMVSMANKSSRDTGRRVAGARARLAGQSYGGGRRPFGYRPDPDAPKYHKTLIVVEAEAAELRKIAADVLADRVSLKAAAQDLRDRHVPTVSGTPWSAKTLRDVMIKPAAAGVALVDGELIDCPWEPIIDRPVWEALRDKLTDPARRTNTGNANAPRWLCSGWATCGVCHGRTKVLGGRGRAPSYQCAEGQHVRRNAARLDAYVSGLVVGVLERDDQGDLLKPAPAAEVDTPRLRAQRRRLGRIRKEQIAMHGEGVITTAELRASLADLAAKVAKIEAALAVSDQPDPLPEFRPAARQGRTAAQVWESLPIARRRAVAQAVIKSVAINRQPTRGRAYPIEQCVTWEPQAAA